MSTRPPARRSACAFIVLLLLSACADDGTGPGDDPENTLELPEVVAGVPLELSEFEGAEFVDTTAAWDQALASLGVDASDLSLAVAVAPTTSTLSLQVIALTARDVDWSARLASFADEVAADGGITLEQTTLAGRSVRRARLPGEPFAAYYHAVGDVLFTIWTDDQGVAEEVLAPLGPASGVAPGRPATRRMAAGRSVSPSRAGPILTAVVTRPLPPVCVAEPLGRHTIVATTMVLTAAGPFPDPFVTVSAFPAWGMLIPSLSVGMYHSFAYAATAFGFNTADVVDLHATSAMLGATGTERLEFDVQHCLEGTWEDGPRTLRISHAGSQVTATIETGTLVCGATGVAFSGSLDQRAAIATMSGNDLKACNPPECVDEGLLEETVLTSYEMMVADDGLSADVEWTRTLFDFTYDDQGTLVACTESGTEQRTFSISRLTFGQGPAL